jgi:hypothetical protein
MPRRKARKSEIILRIRSFIGVNRNHYRAGVYLNKNNPRRESTIPVIRSKLAGSLKNMIPMTAINAAPPAKTIGTAESGPPFWNKRKKATVPAPYAVGCG